MHNESFFTWALIVYCWQWEKWRESCTSKSRPHSTYNEIPVQFQNPSVRQLIKPNEVSYGPSYQQKSICPEKLVVFFALRCSLICRVPSWNYSTGLDRLFFKMGNLNFWSLFRHTKLLRRMNHCWSIDLMQLDQTMQVCSPVNSRLLKMCFDSPFFMEQNWNTLQPIQVTLIAHQSFTSRSYEVWLEQWWWMLKKLKSFRSKLFFTQTGFETKLNPKELP